MSQILGPDGLPARRTVVATRGPRALALGNLYEAASRRDFRGYVYVPSLSPAEQLTGLTLSALRDRTEVLYANGGAPRMLIDGLSLDEAGTGIWPKWVTGKEDFDKAATDAFHFANHDPRFFSADGQNDAYSVQYAIRRCIARYGDCFGQLLRPFEGSMQPTLHLIPGYQCDNPSDAKLQDGWMDGVRRNTFGRPIEYCFHFKGLDGTAQQKRVPADDVLHFHDPFMPGQVRGEPCLAPVAKKMFRLEDIGKALANGTLARERLGFALEYKDDAQGGPSLAELGAGGEEDNATDDDATPEERETVTLRDVFGPEIADEIAIPKLPNGTKIATVESNRPGTQVLLYNDTILREAAWARKYPAEYVFFKAGVGQGTVSRSVMVAAGLVIVAARELQMRPQFCIRWPVFWVWQMIKGGYFARKKITPPENWYAIKHVFPALPTVDIAREGALHDGRVARGLESIEAYHGMQGEDAGDVEDENIAAILRRFRKLKELNGQLAALGFDPLTYEGIWSRNVNTPVIQAVTQTIDPNA